MNADGKREALLKVRDEIGAKREQIIGIGDGANDLKFMAEAGVSIAYHAKPVVREYATHALNYVILTAPSTCSIDTRCAHVIPAQLGSPQGEGDAGNSGKTYVVNGSGNRSLNVSGFWITCAGCGRREGVVRHASSPC